MRADPAMMVAAAKPASTVLGSMAILLFGSLFGALV
jgi:hypothetical protein